MIPFNLVAKAQQFPGWQAKPDQYGGTAYMRERNGWVAFFSAPPSNSPYANRIYLTFRTPKHGVYPGSQFGDKLVDSLQEAVRRGDQFIEQASSNEWYGNDPESARNIMRILNG